MGYVRLKEHSDWGSVYLALPGQGTRNGTSDHRLGIPFKDGQRVHVRWPDNSQSHETIVHRSFVGKESDMGHTYDITYERPGIEQMVRGVTHWTPLADLWVLEEELPR